MQLRKSENNQCSLHDNYKTLSSSVSKILKTKLVTTLKSQASEWLKWKLVSILSNQMLENYKWCHIKLHELWRCAIIGLQFNFHDLGL
jgi:hypothetical protein